LEEWSFVQKLSFCVDMKGILNGSDEFPKQALEQIVHEQGGKIVQYPADSTHHIIAAKKGTVNGFILIFR
jgi:hypothetical protein